MMDVNRPDIVSQLRAELERYEAALRVNDVATLNSYFLDHSATVRYGVAEHCYGYEGIRAYREQAAPIPPGRELLRTSIMTFGENFGSVSTEFASPGAGLIGRQSQTWLRTDRGWKIAAAHVSVIDETRVQSFGHARE